MHCVLHVVGGENNLLGKCCTSCGLIDVVDKEGRCSTCDPNIYKRPRLAKQREFGLWLDNNEHGDYVLLDQRIDGGECGNERPDFMWDCGTHRLILEVDEDQHKYRPEVCECTRMVNITIKWYANDVSSV